MIEAGLEKRVYALLKVRNEGRRDLRHVVPVCTVTTTGDRVPCFWSNDKDGQFSLGGGPSADLEVWHDRALLFAQAFGKETLWARLPTDQSILMEMPAVRERSIAERNREARFISRAGEILDLGDTLGVTLTFRAERFTETVQLELSFGADGPTVSLVT
jgi:hypothetical protein